MPINDSPLLLLGSHEPALLDAQRDRLTGVYNRETLLVMLFRETDRAQRMDSSLCLVLFDVDDFGHWNSRLGTEACNELLRQVAVRTGRLLRSYDLLGRTGKDEFLVVLPGCSPENTIMLAERLRADVFSAPFRVNIDSIQADSIRLSSCFGVAVSRGRSPVVVLREAEQALAKAREMGPEMIECFGGAGTKGARDQKPGTGYNLGELDPSYFSESLDRIKAFLKRQLKQRG